MSTTHTPINRVMALFPLGEVKATPQVIRQIPRQELFAAVQSHASGETNVAYLSPTLEGEEIISVHQSGLSGQFFIKTWVKKKQTLVWLALEEKNLKDLKVLP